MTNVWAVASPQELTRSHRGEYAEDLIDPLMPLHSVVFRSVERSKPPIRAIRKIGR
jgi:hypothetical protein